MDIEDIESWLWSGDFPDEKDVKKLKKIVIKMGSYVYLTRILQSPYSVKTTRKLYMLYCRTWQGEEDPTLYSRTAQRLLRDNCNFLDDDTVEFILSNTTGSLYLNGHHDRLIARHNHKQGDKYLSQADIFKMKDDVVSYLKK
jgi:hypothetical protein